MNDIYYLLNFKTEKIKYVFIKLNLGGKEK